MNSKQTILLLGRLILLCSIIRSTEGFSGGGAIRKGGSKSSRPVIPSSSFAHKSADEGCVAILPAPNGKGMGAFSTAFIGKGDIVGEYFGEILTRKQVETRYWNKRKENRQDRKWRNSRKRRNQGISGDYLFDMGNDVYIDGEDADVSSWCRFANHASPGKMACNVEALAGPQEDQDDENPHLYFVALADIEKGVELQDDYGEEYWDAGGNYIKK